MRSPKTVIKNIKERMDTKKLFKAMDANDANTGKVYAAVLAFISNALNELGTNPEPYRPGNESSFADRELVFHSDISGTPIGGSDYSLDVKGDYKFEPHYRFNPSLFERAGQEAMRNKNLCSIEMQSVLSDEAGQNWPCEKHVPGFSSFLDDVANYAGLEYRYTYSLGYPPMKKGKYARGLNFEDESIDKTARPGASPSWTKAVDTTLVFHRDDIPKLQKAVKKLQAALEEKPDNPEQLFATTQWGELRLATHKEARHIVFR